MSEYWFNKAIEYAKRQDMKMAQEAYAQALECVKAQDFRSLEQERYAKYIGWKPLRGVHDSKQTAL